MVYTLRFDMRAPSHGATPAELYAAALEICTWADRHDVASVSLCEHHMSPDGYLPSPLIMAAAIAARTERLPITIAIFQLPLYSPVRLAEEMCVLDIISKGRVTFYGAIGYVPYEYAMHGVDFHRRGAIAEEYLPLVLKAITGEPFEYEGRRIQVTPPPFTPGGPRLGWGGASNAAAKRAGKYGVDFLAQSGDPARREVYEEAARHHGRTPGRYSQPQAGNAAVVFVADDLDAAWAELGPYLLHDVRSYAAWNEHNRDGYSISFTTTADELRAENRSHRILTVEQAVAHVRAGASLPLHPLIGGLPPQIAWRYLETVAERVLPALKHGALCKT